MDTWETYKVTHTIYVKAASREAARRSFYQAYVGEQQGLDWEIIYPDKESRQVQIVSDEQQQHLQWEENIRVRRADGDLRGDT